MKRQKTKDMCPIPGVVCVVDISHAQVAPVEWKQIYLRVARNYRRAKMTGEGA